MQIVVAEDDRVSRTMISRTLEKWGYSVHEAADGRDAWEMLQETKSQLLVTDWEMPVMDGLELCRRVRAAPLPYYVYIILATSKGLKEDTIEGRRSGADDFLAKPFEREELQVRLRVAERIITLESQLREARSRLEIMASIDDLTGVANRRAVLKRLHEELSRAARDHTDLSVVMADIDHFKNLNDTWGHAAGDHVLKEIVARFVQEGREYDVVGRVGGEEFVVILPQTSLAQAEHRAERLRSGVARKPVILANGTTVDVRVSLGVACAVGGNAPNTDVLLAGADRALYRAKDQGRNRVETEPDLGRAA